MRMMMKVSVPIEAANEAIQDGRMQKLVTEQLQKLRPESVYFFADDDVRTALLFIDVKSESDLLVIADPFFQGLNACVRFTPVMNAQDYQAGMVKLASG